MIEGLAGNITGQKRAKGFADQLAKIAPDLKVVASLPGDWDRQKAANITNDTMTANPDLVGIFCANDTMALGAVESVYAAGKGGEIVMIGVDGNSDAVEVDQGRPPDRQRRAAAVPGRQAGGGEGQGTARRHVGGQVHLRPDPGADQGTDGCGYRPGPAIREVV